MGGRSHLMTVVIGCAVITASTALLSYLLPSKKRPLSARVIIYFPRFEEAQKGRSAFLRWIGFFLLRRHLGWFCNATIANVNVRPDFLNKARKEAESESAGEEVTSVALEIDLQPQRQSKKTEQTAKFLSKKLKAALEYWQYPYMIHHQNFCCSRQVIAKEELLSRFQEIVQLYHEMPLPEYSRYKNWTQSCYLEVHERWTPKTDINESLYLVMKDILLQAKQAFQKWYCFKNNLEKVDVVTMNSFITKYIPVDGKREFGKHVDGAKIDGSLILALPEELDLESISPELARKRERHNWPGLLVWDAPKQRKVRSTESNISKEKLNAATSAIKEAGFDEFLIKLAPGDCCFLENMIWHHGLPITTGARYVVVCFYQCVWKKIIL